MLFRSGIKIVGVAARGRPPVARKCGHAAILVSERIVIGMGGIVADGKRIGKCSETCAGFDPAALVAKDVSERRHK